MTGSASVNRGMMMNCKIPSLCLVVPAVLFGSILSAADDKKPAKAVTPESRPAKWWTERHAEKLKQLKSTKSVDLLMIGDSITHGWEGRGKQVWSEYYAKRNAFNIGYGGDRTEHVIWRLQHGEVEGISPKLAVIMIGTNNTGHRQDPAPQTAAGIKMILGELKKRLPKTKVLLLAVFPRGATADDKLRKLNTGINKIIKGYANGKSVFFLNINSTFLDDDGKLPKAIMPDLLHPREKGYRMWAEAMEPTIKKLIGD